MRLHDLHPAPGTNKEQKRRGRGTATGQGKTGGRGQNGQGSRSGGHVRPG
ncbi:MAG TPA: 50S ribosomal protein L15, partial [Clostridiaceae bacterium]|nr:50S ribosomal protein L15 [Clostridiaceae bacterium]